MISSLARRRSSWLAALAAVSGVALAPALFATTWVTLTVAQLKAQSEVVAVGTITGKTAEAIAVPWFSDPDGDMIYTRYEMRIDRGVKGAKAGETVSFVSMGGVIGGRGVDVPGAPQFEVGEKIVGGFFMNGIDRLQPHWGGVNRVASVRRGEVVIGETGHTVERNRLLGEVVADLERK